VQWPSGQSVAKELASANVPNHAMTHSDSKVAAARSLLRELRLMLADNPPREAPWTVPEIPAHEPPPKRQRAESLLQLPPVALGIAPPLPPPTVPPS
jgi:hypothetical protein